MQRQLHLRVFNTALQLGEQDGRTVFGRLLRWNDVATFRDFDGKIKKERFIRGSLDDARNAWHRVKLVYQHDDGFTGHIGHGVSLDSRDDGPYAVFRLNAVDADKAREILTTTHKGLSLGFYSLSDRMAGDGVVDRMRVAVEHVGAVQEGAYDGGAVLGVRADVSEVDRAPGGDAPPPNVETRAATPHLDEVKAALRTLRMTPEERRAYLSAFPEHRQ